MSDDEYCEWDLISIRDGLFFCKTDCELEISDYEGKLLDWIRNVDVCIKCGKKIRHDEVKQ